VGLIAPALTARGDAAEPLLLVIRHGAARTHRAPVPRLSGQCGTVKIRTRKDLILECAPRATVACVSIMSQAMSVAQVAGKVGVRPDTIRYYERAGLLPPPPRTSGAHRRYGEETIDRLHFIQGAQRLGLRLRDIATLLAVRDTGSCPCEPAEQLLRQRISEIDAELARLSTLRVDLLRMADALPANDCPDPEPGKWCPPGMRR